MSANTLSEAMKQKFSELAETRSDVRCSEALQTIISEGSDLDCYKINAYRFAAACNTDLNTALQTLLFATRLGILDLNYDVFCPSCLGNVDYSRHLMGIPAHPHCGLCVIDFDVSFLDQIEVTFTVNPNVRRIDVVPFKERDYDGMIQYFSDIYPREGRSAIFHLPAMHPGNSYVSEAEIQQPMRLDYWVPLFQGNPGHLEIAGEPIEGVQDLHLTVNPDASLEPLQLSARPGHIRLTVEYNFNRPDWTVIVSRRQFMNWLSATYVTNQQDFRDLFSGEYLEPGTTFGVQSITLMFTDIRESTELYEELGDSGGFALVQDHFGIMTEIIRAHDGSIVKTIGDAVMASFPINRNAVAAAIEIQRAFHRQQVRGRVVEVKIGLHRGPSIAVTSNRNLDFFGRSVNMAARIQGRSAPSEVWMSQDVVRDPGVRDLLGEERLDLRAEVAHLKGIADNVALAAIRPVQVSS